MKKRKRCDEVRELQDRLAVSQKRLADALERGDELLKLAELRKVDEESANKDSSRTGCS